jgi:hypothetical protein
MRKKKNLGAEEDKEEDKEEKDGEDKKEE